MDWKYLHEKADGLTEDEVRSYAESHPESIEDLYVLGLAYLNLHEDDEAREVFERILGRDERSIQARWGIAEVLRRKHILKKSQGDLEEIIDEQPLFSPAYISLAYLKYTIMDFKETVALAYKVLGQGRENVDLSNFTRAYLLVAAGRGMLAYYGGPISKIANGTQILSNLKKAEELQPDSSGVLFGLGSFYFLAPPIAGGDRDKARRYLEEAVERDPLFADAYVRLGQLYRMMGEEEKYRQCIDKVMQIDPENALLLDMRKGECKFICISLEK